MCEDLIPPIIEFSEDQDSVSFPRILKILNMTMDVDQVDKLVCHGTAMWSRGEPFDIYFQWSMDEDGHGFIVYRRR